MIFPISLIIIAIVVSLVSLWLLRQSYHKYQKGQVDLQEEEQSYQRLSKGIQAQAEKAQQAMTALIQLKYDTRKDLAKNKIQPEGLTQTSHAMDLLIPEQLEEEEIRSHVMPALELAAEKRSLWLGMVLAALAGLAAAGLTWWLIFLWGEASTGADITLLVGVARRNAILANLGGGSLATGGGGMRLGWLVLISLVIGMAILVGSAVFRRVLRKLIQHNQNLLIDLHQKNQEGREGELFLQKVEVFADNFYQSLLPLYQAFLNNRPLEGELANKKFIELQNLLAEATQIKLIDLANSQVNVDKVNDFIRKVQTFNTK